MDENLYSPPRSAVRDKELPPGSAVKAVLAAVGVWIG